MPVALRAEQALATRRRMVHAAYQLFCTEGYLGSTMSSIAKEAGVAVQTLYYTFHTKAALLGEAIGGAVVGFDEWRQPPADPEIAELLPWHGWWADFQSASSSAEALNIYVTNGVQILERVGPLIAAMHGGAGDPDGRAVLRTAEERRVATYREVARVIARKPGGLRHGLSESAAADLLFVLFSAEVYQALSAGRGWSRPRCTKFFQQMLASQLLAHIAPTSAGRMPTPGPLART